MPFPAKEGWKEGSDERWSSCRHLRKKRQRAPAFSPLLFFFFYWHTDRWLLLRAVPGSLVAGKPLNGCARKSQKRAIERERERERKKGITFLVSHLSFSLGIGVHHHTMRRTGPPYKARICPFRWPGPFVFPMRLSELERELSIPTKSNFDLKGNGGRYMSNRESLDISGEPSFWLPWWRGRLPKNRPPSIHTTVGCCCWPGGHAQKLLNGCFIIINREARKKVV